MIRDELIISGVEKRLHRGVRIALLGIALFVQCAFVLPRLLLHPELYVPLWAHALAFAILLSIGLVAVVHELLDRPMSGSARVVGVGGTVLAVLLTVNELAPHNVMHTVPWTFNVVGWHCLYLLFGEGIGIVLAVLIAHFLLATGQLLLHHRPPDETQPAAMAISVLTVYTFQLTIALFAHLTGPIAKTAARAANAAERSRTEEAIAESTYRDHEKRVLHLLDTTLPLLQALADGELDVADPETQRRCALESARMRRIQAEVDDVADPLAHELSSAIEVAHQRGISTELEVRGDPAAVPKNARCELVDLVISTLAATSGTARVTVAYPAQREARVGVVTDRPERGRPELEFDHVRVREIATDSTVWVEATWEANGCEQETSRTRRHRANSPHTAANRATAP